jgi:PleD family two-component response regulator
MTQPLALVLYERILPGTQLVNRMQDLNYRVLAVTDADTLVSCAEQEKPMLVIADLVSTRLNVCAAIGKLRQHENTRHIPVIAFGPDAQPELQQAALDAGATLATAESAILAHLPELLDQALDVK